MATCPFCQIDEERQQVLIRHQYVYVMPSNPMLRVKKHLLVIPYRHVVHLSALTSEERRDFFDTAVDLQQKIRESQPGLGCDFRQNDRPFLLESPVKVNHVHGHLLLRSFNDILYQEVQTFERFDRLSPEEMRQEEREIRRLLCLP